MPPEVSPCYPILRPSIQFLPKEEHNSQRKYQSSPKPNYKMCPIPIKKLIPSLVFTLSIFSILRLLKTSFTTSFSSLPASPLFPSTTSALTDKEYRLLSNLVALKAPCNLLMFGLERELLNISRLNEGGNTVFLDGNSRNLNAIIATNLSNSTRIYKVEYQTRAGDAFKLLDRARRDPGCGLQNLGSFRKSTCPLALTQLPEEVYKLKWDVIVVDGPRGDSEESPGRMTSVYTAAAIARAGNGANVVIHDVDRMIEKWFAWEFLCDENLVSSKGKLWNFRIAGNTNFTTFCPVNNRVQIE